MEVALKPLVPPICECICRPRWRCVRTAHTNLCCALVIKLVGRPMTRAEIGEHWCISRERARQIESIALAKLRRNIRIGKREFDRPTQELMTVWEQLEEEA